MNTIGILFSFVTPVAVLLYMAARLLLEGDDTRRV